MNKDRLRKHVEDQEERRLLAYPDSNGVMHVGIGFNLEEPNAKKRIAALGIDFDALYSRQGALTDAQADILFDEDLQIATDDSLKDVKNFSDHPEDAQIPIVDMHFNMGSPRFRKFVDLLAALEKKDYSAAADAMLDSLWAKQVPRRAAADIALMRGAA
jgi:GH24 family phage-related lysozyme (muramidase)